MAKSALIAAKVIDCCVMGIKKIPVTPDKNKNQLIKVRNGYKVAKS